jgi:hypothetical protein
MDANYRKHNDRTQNSSTYHKDDGTNIRAILKAEANAEIEEAIFDAVEKYNKIEEIQ